MDMVNQIGRMMTMTSKKTPESQLKASRKWQEKNKEQMSHVRNRSGAKSYIKKASLAELDELEQLIAERRSDLKKSPFDNGPLKHTIVP